MTASLAEITQHLREALDSYGVLLGRYGSAAQDKSEDWRRVLQAAARLEDAVDASGSRLEDREIETRPSSCPLSLTDGEESPSAQLPRHQRDVRLQERKIIAQVLHDEVGHTLTALSLYLSSTLALLDRADFDDKEVAQLLAVANKLAEELRVNVRQIMRGLREPPTSSTDLPAAIVQFAKRLVLPQDVEVHFDVGTLPSLTREMSTALRCIAEEALINAVSHAAATRIDVALGADYDSECPVIRLQIRDDGAGFAQPGRGESDAGGYGLTLMQERAHRIGATLTIITRPGQGTVLTVEAAV